MRFNDTAMLGSKRTETPEGFLLCRDVPIGRVGSMYYGAGELGDDIKPDVHGAIEVTRDASELFRPDVAASFLGKPVTMGHPKEFVTPQTWRQLSVGSMTNIRPGLGEQSDLLLSDLLITDSQAIQAIKTGLREVSIGYEANYRQSMDGKATQHDIVGNHIALVPAGRCGHRCAIGDHKEPNMAKTVMERLLGAFMTQDHKAFIETASELDGTPPPVASVSMDAAGFAAVIKEALAPLESRLAALEPKQAAPAKTADAQTMDAAAAGALQADAEVIAPGFKVVATNDACTCQREALKASYATAPGKAAIDASLYGAAATFDTMSNDAVAMLFRGAVAAMKGANNAGMEAVLKTQLETRDMSHRTNFAKTQEDFWAKHSPTARH